VSQLSRRKFLLASAAALAAKSTAKPAFGQGAAVPSGPAADVDVIIVGAGAAGIAAARKLSPRGGASPWSRRRAASAGRCFT